MALKPGIYLSMSGPRDFIRLISFCKEMKRMLGAGPGAQVFSPETGPVSMFFGTSIHVVRVDDPDMKRHKYLGNYAIMPLDNLGEAIVADYRKAFKDIAYEPEES